ncbi:hypothetical protein Pcinc_033131 [Petrolisthes cinctipes]|uniref:Uncharacterized protein n=1 Tax=Petrolisthes cinctipes TaxID=88211 RepID=A0AAE1JZE1_PETCI|nr:hypothetical protein Pcinc_033131 [Petrolisthes cinctipes]
MASKKVRLNDTEIDGKLGNGKNSRANKDVKTFDCTAGLTDSQAGCNNSAQYESDNVRVLRVTSTIDPSDMDGNITGCGLRSDGGIQTESVSVRRKITNPINIYLPNDQDIECNETDNGEGKVGVCGTVRELSLSTDPGSFNVSESTCAKGLKSGRKEFRLRGEHHVFTVVPVESSGTIAEEPKTPDPDSVVKSNKRLTTDKDPLTPLEQVIQGSSLYNTVKGTTSVPCPHTSYNPYLTVTAAGPSPKTYNPYHTITGLYPSSYQRSEFRLRRVSTFSRREYGVGRSSLSPSLVSMVHQTRSMTGSPIVSKGSLKGTVAHQTADLPCMATPSNFTNRFQQQTGVPLWSDDNSAPSVAPDEATIHSLNQMTVRSAGGVSVGVGSTDGRNMTVRGAVVSPEQLPLLPDTLR